MPAPASPTVHPKLPRSTDSTHSTPQKPEFPHDPPSVRLLHAQFNQRRNSVRAGTVCWGKLDVDEMKWSNACAPFSWEDDALQSLFRHYNPAEHPSRHPGQHTYTRHDDRHKDRMAWES